jgi:hypothetical protein
VLTFKRWFAESYTFNGEVISFDLKHLTAAEEREIRAAVVRVIGVEEGLKAERAVKSEDQAALSEMAAKAMEKISATLPDSFVKECFGKYLRNVKGAADENGPREDGAFVAEFADDAMIFYILFRLLAKGKVSAEEGKGSGSLSTSASEMATSASGSPVTSTGSGAGPVPSTVTVTLERGPSGAQEPLQGV